MAKKDDGQAEVIEEGDIFFLYRPDVEEEHPEGLGDVQRFHVVLRPREGRKLRVLVMGRKRLPKVEEHEQNWGFVEMVTSSAEKVERELQETEYGTKTRGRRRLPAERPAGEDAYAVMLEDGQMHLVYSLELPEKPGDVQKTFNIAPEASYALAVKNPEARQLGPPASARSTRPTIRRSCRKSSAAVASRARTYGCSITRAPSSSWSAPARTRSRPTG